MDNRHAEQRAAHLRTEIERHNRLYYQHAQPEISDQEFDKLLRELQDIEAAHPDLITPDSPTQRIGGAPLEGFAQIAHTVPMMSLDNTYSEEELSEFYARLKKGLGKDHIRCVIEPKVDGVAVAVRYEDGVLKYAATRGDGRVGDDITNNLKTIRSLPLRLPKHVPQTFEVRGEVYMNRADFEKMNDERIEEGEKAFENPRNSTAGTLKSLDPAEVKKRPLRIIFWGLGDQGDAIVNSQSDLHDLLHSANLPRASLTWDCDSVDQVVAAIRQLDSKRHELPYDTDGAVIEVDSFAERRVLGVTAKSPSWARAFKYPPPQAESQILEVEVQVGRTGALTPVARLSPTRLSGTTVSNATLHNFDEIARKDVRKYDYVVIEKRGEIIPAVVEVKKLKRSGKEEVIHPPVKCPICKTPVVKEANLVVLRCPNPTCPEQLTRRLEFFAARRALDIDGIGGIVAQRIVESGLAKHPLDLFGLNASQLAELNLGTDQDKRVFGKKHASKVVAAVERARTMSLERWIFALGILEVGITTARDLARFHSTMSELADSALLKDALREHELAEERVNFSPNSRKNPAHNEEERRRREIRTEEIAKEIKPIQQRLLASGFATLAAGKEDSINTVVGPSAAASVLSYFASDAGRETLLRIDELGIKPNLQQAQFGSDGGALAGKTFVLTGTLAAMSRDEAGDLIRKLGGTVTGSVSKKTSFVVAGSDPGENKIEGAKKHSISVLDEARFFEMIGHQPQTPDQKVRRDLFE